MPVAAMKVGQALHDEPPPSELFFQSAGLRHIPLARARDGLNHLAFNSRDAIHGYLAVPRGLL